MLRRRVLVNPAISTFLAGARTTSLSLVLLFGTRHYTRGGDVGCEGITLSIGDITIPIPDNLRYPERVSWILPGVTNYGDKAVHNDHSCDNNCNENNDLLDNFQLGGGNVFFDLQDSTTRAYLRWMCQKERLRQDMCLVGEPGPAKRWLVQMYSYLLRREVQCLALSRDTTESDLGQRREIRNGTLVYDDQCVVVAAKEGQLLVLDGLEKVERNVLPVLNNLLENREMHLENGMVLIHPERYDRLLHELLFGRQTTYERKSNTKGISGGNKSHEAGSFMTLAEAHEELRRMGFIRVSEDFRVVGLTVPVPRYEGNPLDPPLRSRFQCLYVDISVSGMTFLAKSKTKAVATGEAVSLTPVLGNREAAAESLLRLFTIIDEVNASTREFATGVRQATVDNQASSISGCVGGAAVAMPHSGLQNIGTYEMMLLLRQLQMFPNIPLGDVLPRAFPWMLYAQQTSAAGAAHVEEAARRRREYQRLLDVCKIGVPSFDCCSDFLSNDDCHDGAGDSSFAKKGPSPDRTTTRFSLSSSGEGFKRVTQSLHEKVVSLCASGTDSDSTTGAMAGRRGEEFNDVLRIEKIGFSKQYSDLIVGEACIACTSEYGTRCGKDGFTYSLPIYMGEAAISSTTTKTGSEFADAIVVAERCLASRSVFTPAHFHVLQSMLQLHIAGQHILLIGPSGCGKTMILREFARLLGYRTNTMYLYADMTNKDLFQRRTTDSSTGDTTWKNTALIEAALCGHIAVLDGIDKLPHWMLSSLQQLLVDGSTSLYNGTLLKSRKEYDILKQRLKATDEDMRGRGIFPVHPAFRVVATARPASSAGSGAGKTEHKGWRISQEVTSLFGLVMMPAATRVTLRAVLQQVATEELRVSQNGRGAAVTVADRLGNLNRDVDRLLRLRDALEQLQATEPKIPQLSLRQLLHLIRFSVNYPNDFTHSVECALLLPLMTTLTAGQVRHIMRLSGFNDVGDEEQPQHDLKLTERMGAYLQEGHCTKSQDILTEILVSDNDIENTGTSIGFNHTNNNSNNSKNSGDGGATLPRVFGAHGKPILYISRVYTENERAAVLYVPHFYTNSLHETIIAWLAKQYAVGNNILLIGNQGVGKNKVVDAFLARIGVPRQYIQLHRDTTVGSLTINPAVECGRVVWVDSPLVKAVQRGHCLVVDEIDKAPVEVVQVLKGLVEDHEMRLRDGRQIRGPKAHFISVTKSGKNKVCDSDEDTDIIAMHPDFRIIVLANPPGFPFHGNDFYRECGDLFASYVMSNPDALSQLRVLKAYGPSIPEKLLMRLVNAFQRLQKSFEEGHLTYPFSLRELIAVVKHIAAFPNDGIYDALNNVFNFDVCDENTLRHVREVLHLHLQQLVSAGGMKRLLPLRTAQELLLRSLPQFLEAQSSLLLPFAAHHIDTEMSLSVRFLTEAECGGPLRPQSATIWREQYKESDFTGVVPNVELDGFTEWLGAPHLPFLRSQDVVLGVTTLDAYAADTAVLTCVVVLFLRPAEDSAGGGVKADDEARSKQSLTLAVVRLPSVSSVGVIKTGKLDIASGQVKFFDLSKFFPNAFFASSTSLPLLHKLNAQSHGALVSSFIQHDMSLDTFGLNATLVAVVNPHSGFVLLINLLAAAVTQGEVCVSSPQLAKHRKKEYAPDAVLPVRLLPSFSGLLSPCLFSVRQSSGTVAMTRPQSAELYVWMNGCRIAITLPAESVDDVLFFADNLAAVRLLAGGKTLYAVVKVAVFANGKARASLCLLPSGASGPVVGFTSGYAAAWLSEDELLRSLAPGDLLGAVIVPRDCGPNTENVVYMTVNNYLPDKKLWTMRVFTNAEAAVAVCSNPLCVDFERHQLLAIGYTEAKHDCGVVAVDFYNHTWRRFAAPPTLTVSSKSSARSHFLGLSFFTVDEGTGVALGYDQTQQRLLAADVMAGRVEHRYRTWSALLDGSVKQIGAPTLTSRPQLPMKYDAPRKKPSGTVKHGMEDDKEHHGGNTYAGGTGGTDTAGLGGIVGPYRLDKGWPVHQVPPELKKQVPQHIIDEAKRMGKQALAERLQEIGMSAKEHEQYRALRERVCAPVALLRSILGSLKAGDGERTWLRGQSDGVWDDNKIVEGIVGDSNIYKRRVNSEDTNIFDSRSKKRLLFVLDVSASMYRFEGVDHRLTRLLESTVMVMEAFAGFEDKIDYAMVGHNGDSACIELVLFGQQPANQKARMEVCQRMIAYAQYCWSGDNTVAAMRKSIDFVTAEEASAYLVFVISDANLAQYGISARELGAIVRSRREVQMFCIFIATLGKQASDLHAEMPPGHSFECMDTQALPHILKQIFISVNLL